MPFEIEMLSVGAASAIILRYIDELNKEVIILIDAGNKKDGKKVVDAINNWTTKKSIDLAISTHPDNDHIGGFFYIIEHMEIKELWIHDPSKHFKGFNKLREILHSKDEFEKGLKNVLESLDNSDNLLTLIDSMGINRDNEPFAGLVYEFAPLKVVGPSVDYYESLLVGFRDAEVLLKEEDLLVKSLIGGEILNESISSHLLLNRDNDKSKENNSSTILLFKPPGRKYLFTSDAGPEALEKVRKEYDLSNLSWLDVPHHGSRYNLTTQLINIFTPKIAYISCNGSHHYPSLAVVAELKKVGCMVYSTAHTGNLLHRKGTSPRSGYTKAIPLS